MWAVAHSQSAVVEVLLDHGAAIDARTKTVQQLRGTGERSTTSPQGATYFDAGGFTPLLFAARHGDVATAQVLLEAGADVNDTSADGNSALVLAAMSGHEGLARFLLGQGADPNVAGAGYSALHAALLRSQPLLVRDLLAHGANPNARLVKGTPVPRWTYQFIFTLREKGATPVMLAAKYLEPKILKMLAEAGGDVLIPMEDGTTALMAAVGLGLSRSTNRRSRLIAPELVSAEWEDEDLVLATVEMAVAAGAAAVVNEVWRAGNTALHGAARGRFERVVAFLAAEGGDLEIANEDGATVRQILDRLEVRAESNSDERVASR
jgi:ankyrin repeat protein